VTLSAWESVTDDSRLALRFLSIAAGILTVALTYRVGTDLFGQRTGLYGALLLSVLPMAVYYSQEVRDYGWLTASVTLMTLLFLRYLRRPRRRQLIAYSLSVALMVYTLYFGVLFLVVHGSVGLLVWRASSRKKAGLIGAWLAALVLYVPWLVVVVQQFQRLAGGIRNTPATIPEAVQESMRLMLSGAAVPLVGLYALGAWYVLRRSEYRTTRLTILLCGSGVLILMLGINLKVGIIAPRTLAFLTPMLMIMCGYGLSLLDVRLALPVTSALVISFLVTHPVIRPRLSSDQVAETLAAHYAPGDLIVLENGWDDYALGYEILLKLGDAAVPEIIRTISWESDYLPQAPVVPQIEGDLRAHRRVWLVNWLVHSQVGQYLDGGGTGYKRVLTYQVPVGAEYTGLYPDPNVRLILYEKPPVNPCPCTGYQFGDTLWLRDNVFGETVQCGHTAQIDLWWSSLKTPPQDYTVVAFMLDTHDLLRVRDDHLPATPTTQWKAGDPYFDRHSLSIPPDLPLGTYQLAVKVYITDRDWLPVGGNEYVVIGAIRVVE
jgi:Dolichyl-phosphate-mannose-protein mannosyltransferase